MSYEEGRPGGFDPHKRILDMKDRIAGASPDVQYQVLPAARSFYGLN